LCGLVPKSGVIAIILFIGSGCEIAVSVGKFDQASEGVGKSSECSGAPFFLASIETARRADGRGGARRLDGASSAPAHAGKGARAAE
jgi:hypothetical protein